MFHALNYIRGEVIPTLFAPVSNYAQARKASRWIGIFVQKNEPLALQFAAYVEVWVIMPWVIVSVFNGNASFLTPLLYGHFLRFRYFFSPVTKRAFRDLRLKGDGLVLDNVRLPMWVKNIYVRIRDALEKFGNVEGPKNDTPPNPPQQ